MITMTEVSRHYCAAAGCEALYEVRQPSIGLHAFIALHDLSHGPGFGGIRRMAYPTREAAVRDVVQLAEQMTLKARVAELPCGGAKAVIIDHPDLYVRAAYEALGEVVARLDGSYYCGPDVGTRERELQCVRRSTRYVNLPDNSPSASTARGVLAACDAALRHVEDVAPDAFSAAVQGVGSVGFEIARGLMQRGGRLTITDIDDDRLQAARAQLGAVTLTHPDEIVYAPTQLLSPCAIGPVIHKDTIAKLNCRIICGAANSQLADPTLAHELAAAGILYVPDFAVNAGAVIEGVMSQLLEDATRQDINAAIDAIGARTTAILQEARAQGWTPLEVALART